MGRLGRLRGGAVRPRAVRAREPVGHLRRLGAQIEPRRLGLLLEQGGEVDVVVTPRPTSACTISWAAPATGIGTPSSRAASKPEVEVLEQQRRA